MPDTFIVRGGKPLKGSIDVKGAKNDALIIFAAALLTPKRVRIVNVPEIEDIKRMSEILIDLGVTVKHIRPGIYDITARQIKTSIINPELSEKLRASIVLTAPLLARTREALFPHPGGCVIGERPIDIFLNGYKAFGAAMHRSPGGLYRLHAKHIKGITFVFNQISVTATESLMMLATLAKGKTILKNCALEPEVVSLAQFLNQCGAKVSGAGTPEITIQGVPGLTRGAAHETIPDRIETGSLAILAAATGSTLTITKCNPEHLDSLWSVLRRAGVKVEIRKTSVTIRTPKTLESLDVKTHEYPGFPTDLQAPVCVLLTQATGQGIVHETIYEGRLLWTEELQKMGANILMCDPHRVAIYGPTKLRGWDIESPDIRAGMAYLIAALCAKGTSRIRNVYQIDRGYENIEERLQKIGANIKRI